MAVQTSSITTAANGNLAITPNGTGQVRISTLTGNNNQPVGVDNNGELYQFNITDLTAGTPAGTDILMMEIGGAQVKVTAQQLFDSTSGIKLSDLSVTTAAATGSGALAYNNGTGVFTFTPPSLAGLGGISLAALSVTQNTAAGAGALTYANTTGVFSYTPPTIAGLGGIGLAALSVSVAAAAGAGNLTYSNTTGVFTYTPPTAAGLGALALTSLSVTTAATGSATGGLAYNNATGVFTYTPVAGGASLAAATAAEAAAGTLTTVYLSPATGIARDAAGTTGAALMPSGTTAQRPAASAAGMTRFNSDTGSMEFYNGTTWSSIGGGGLGNIYDFNGFSDPANSRDHTHGLNVASGQYLAQYNMGGPDGLGNVVIIAFPAGVTITGTTITRSGAVAKTANLISISNNQPPTPSGWYLEINY